MHVRTSHRRDLAGADGKAEPHKPLFSTVDLDRGEYQDVQLTDGTKMKVKLLDVEEIRDSLRSAVRLARVKVEINGSTVTLTSGNYRLPVTVAGLQVDCPATKGLYRNHDKFEDSWGLDKDVRLRLWPVKSPLDGAGHVCLSGQAALVCGSDTNRQRAILRRWRGLPTGEAPNLLPLRQ